MMMILFFYPRNLPLKVGQNRVSNRWNVVIVVVIVVVIDVAVVVVHDVVIIVVVDPTSLLYFGFFRGS